MGSVILLYHRVGDYESDAQSLTVSPKHFSEHLDVIKRCARSVSLSRALSLGSSEPRRVALTFDDGYSDNLHHATPALQRHDIPASIFVTVGFIGTTKEFYWDELERRLLLSTDLPDQLALTGPRGKRFTLPLADPIAAYNKLCGMLQPLPDAERADLLAQIADILRERGGYRHRVLSESELEKLASCHLIEIGAHTLNHPVLATRPPADEAFEITRSKSRLEELVGRPIHSFSYPYGSFSDYSKRTVDAVRRAGFECACANVPGSAHASRALFDLRRRIVRDWDGEEFERRLEGWLAG